MTLHGSQWPYCAVWSTPTSLVSWARLIHFHRNFDLISSKSFWSLCDSWLCAWAAESWKQKQVVRKGGREVRMHRGGSREAAQCCVCTHSPWATSELFILGNIPPWAKITSTAFSFLSAMKYLCQLPGGWCAGVTSELKIICSLLHTWHISEAARTWAFLLVTGTRSQQRDRAECCWEVWSLFSYFYLSIITLFI